MKLLKAEELGITQLAKSDFYGGLAAFLSGFDLSRFGASAAGITPSIEGTTLVLTLDRGDGSAAQQMEIPNHASLTGMTTLAANASGSGVTGGHGDELWIAAPDVASTFTDVSSRLDQFSNDTLIGSSQGDTINAGVGMDFIRGGAGNDAITSGLGNDTVVFSRGDGEDTVTDGGTAIARVTPVRNIKAIDDLPRVSPYLLAA